MRQIFKTLFLIGLVIGGIKVILDKAEEYEHMGDIPYEAAPCEEMIDYDWDAGKPICPCDTATMMQNPYGRGWILKSEFRKIERVKPIPGTDSILPKTRAEEVLEIADDLGL